MALWSLVLNYAVPEVCKRRLPPRGPPYLFQFSIINPAKQTKIPNTFTQEILSLNTNTATGTRSKDQHGQHAAIQKFQPAR